MNINVNVSKMVLGNSFSLMISVYDPMCVKNFINPTTFALIPKTVRKIGLYSPQEDRNTTDELKYLVCSVRYSVFTG